MIVRCPPGLSAEPGVVEGDVPAEATMRQSVTLSAARDAPRGVALVTLDVTRDGVRHGELFDCVVNVG